MAHDPCSTSATNTPVINILQMGNWYLLINCFAFTVQRTMIVCRCGIKYGWFVRLFMGGVDEQNSIWTTWNFISSFVQIGPKLLVCLLGLVNIAWYRDLVFGAYNIFWHHAEMKKEGVYNKCVQCVSMVQTNLHKYRLQEHPNYKYLNQINVE